MKKFYASALVLAFAIAAGIGGPLFYVCNSENQLGILDAGTGIFSQLHYSSVFETFIFGLGFGADGTFYGVQDAGGFYLVEIDTNAGKVDFPSGYPYHELFPPMATPNMTSLPNGTLYALDVETLTSTIVYIINTNATTNILGTATNCLNGGFAGNSTGLFAMQAVGTERLFSLNLTNGAATAIGYTGTPISYAMAFSGNTLYMVDTGGGIWTVNTTTGAATRQPATCTNSATIYTMIAVPVPATPALAITNLGGGQVQLTWSAGVLQSATELNGPFTDMTNLASPCSVPVTSEQMFFRVHNP